MKYLALLSALFAVTLADFPSEWGNMVEPCIETTITQIGCEIRASLEYFKFGSHFSRDDINRPGFAKFFFDSASEEREHGIKLIEYLTMRGAAQPFDNKADLGHLLKNAGSCDIFSIRDECYASGHQALQCALEMEVAVTTAINKLIRTCEAPKCDAESCPKNAEKSQGELNDYHLVDYLTGEFLEEQYKGQREIAGRMKTLEKLTHTHGNIGEFLFDKQMLE
jgi:ferritin heavy chain